MARECLRALQRRGRRNPTVTILGMTFKENVPDIRNSKVIDIVRELGRGGVTVQVHDPIALPEEAAREYGADVDAVREARAGRCRHHGGRPWRLCRAGLALGRQLLKGGEGIVLDVKSRLDRAQTPKGIDLWRL